MEVLLFLDDALIMLKKTSRTFFIPIDRLVPGLKEAVASAYLCMRAIDEIEDHEELDDELKIQLLRQIRDLLAAPADLESVKAMLAPYQDRLPEVSVRLHEWAMLCPATVSEVVLRYTAKMSDQMADWVKRGWSIRTVEDLDGYTYSVAGMVGEMLSEIWLWFDGTKTDPVKAVAFGRGLQAVNILRNREEDLKRGVDFYPEGWGNKEMIQYTRRNLALGDAYNEELRGGPALEFCKIPLKLAHATLNLIAAGGNKLTRQAVLKLVNSLS